MRFSTVNMKYFYFAGEYFYLFLPLDSSHLNVIINAIIYWRNLIINIHINHSYALKFELIWIDIIRWFYFFFNSWYAIRFLVCVIKISCQSIRRETACCAAVHPRVAYIIIAPVKHAFFTTRSPNRPSSLPRYISGFCLSKIFDTTNSPGGFSGRWSRAGSDCPESSAVVSGQ